MKHVQDFFNLTHKERNGFLVFTIFILGLTFVPSIWSALHTDPVPEYTLQVFPPAPSGLYPKEVVDRIPKKRTVIHSFNPNRLPAKEWEKFGLSPKQIAVIHRYEEKGGTFRTKEDVQKMYVIDDALYRKLAPFIRIPAADQSVAEVNRVPPAQSTTYPVSIAGNRSKVGKMGVRIEINRADTADWKMIRGIGSVYAARIVRFRERLGGFHQLEQLHEVYGLPEERLEEWFAQLYLESPNVRKLRVNQLTSDDMQKHPYISRKQAERIVAYRNQHGGFKSIEDMRKILVLDTDFFVKIEPYLDFQR